MKLLFDIILKPIFFISAFIFCILNIVIFNLPFFSINNNDEIFSAIDVSISSSYLFSFILSSYLINQFIVKSISDKLYMNLMVKPFGSYKYLLSNVFSTMLISMTFHLISLSTCLFFLFKKTYDFDFKILYSSIILSFLFSNICSILSLPLTIIFRSENALILNIIFVALLNAAPDYFILSARMYSIGDLMYTGGGIPLPFLGWTLLHSTMILAMLMLFSLWLLDYVEAT